MISANKRKTFLDIFPTPEFMLLSTTGIAITDASTKFVELDRELSHDEFKPVHLGKIENPKGAVENGVINNTAEITAILKQIASTYGVKYTRAILPEERAYLFTTKINWVPKEGLRDAVAFIVEENVPVSLAESIFDFQVVKNDRAYDEIVVAVSVIPRTVIDNYIQLFESAGITPISFDVESQAMAKSLIHHGDKRSQLIVNLAKKKTGFYIVEQEVTQFSTTVAYGFDNENSETNIEEIKREMGKVISFWNEKSEQADKIEKIVLCGPGAGREDIVNKVMDGLEARFELADVWVNLSPSRSYVSKVPFADSLEYASVIGSALISRFKIK